ncbi:MAG: Alpha/Beta hydrolase protein [Monoraphidium minutum]|nr:MAG: Alpha/Beta hydrolase protein [Monoraphidium minutum]
MSGTALEVAEPSTRLDGELRTLYPASTPFETGTLGVSDLHTIYYEVHGNPRGAPALFLHGGPGAGCYPNHARFFDPAHYKIVLLDQRGCGRSAPRGCLKDNTTAALVSDLEALRSHLRIDSWAAVLGGSWGSALAVAYAQAHPGSTRALVLRGVCLMRPQEIGWMYAPPAAGGGAAALRPRQYAAFAGGLPPRERGNPLLGHYARLVSGDDAEREAAARAWMGWEMAAYSFTTAARAAQQQQPPAAAGGAAAAPAAPPPPQPAPEALLTAHYSLHGGFLLDAPLLDPDLLSPLRDRVICLAVQGGADLVCPPASAFELSEAWPEAEVAIVAGAGHSMYDPAVTHELVVATDRLRALA